MLPTHEELAETFIQNVYWWESGIFMPFLQNLVSFVNSFRKPHCALVRYWWSRLLNGTRNTLYLDWACLTRLKLPCWHTLAKCGFIKLLIMVSTRADWDVLIISSLWISTFTTTGHLSFPSFTVTNNIWWHEFIRVWFLSPNIVCVFGKVDVICPRLLRSVSCLPCFMDHFVLKELTILPRGCRQKVFRNVSTISQTTWRPVPERNKLQSHWGEMNPT